MGLSFDLISEFVKITNDKKESPKEGTVYATVVSGTGGKYVKIDGSDLLTPMETTTDIEDGERVTLMIKDHKAVVMGNVTNPSASTGKVDKVSDSITSVSERVGTFELVVADKVSTNELEAYKATIEVLIAGKATIEDLTATNAKIENLEVKNAEIENLVAEKVTIKDLEVVNATIENLKVKDAEIENAVVENLKATTADIKILNADFAQIKTLVNGNLTSDNILSFNLTSEKVTVDDAFIKDAMIDTISAGKINAGKINTNSVSIGSEDGGMLITGSTQQFTDKNGNVRIQIGKDASGDFTFVLYGEDGTGQLINQNGITASAIGDGLIVNNMVSDNAAISGGKLDISSVIMEINGDTSTTIKSSKIYLNEQNQSLEVAFNSLKTKVDTIQEITIQGDLTAIVEQVQSNTSKIEANSESISTLISEDTVIKKQVTDLKGTVEKTETTLTSKYTSLNQSLEGFKTTVADTYATKSSVTDVVDNLSANYSTTSTMNSAINQKAQEITASVSSTYSTKNEVKTLDDNLKTNYSTTQQMESAINVAKEEINLGVSSIYETKENTTSKINSSINNIQVGGTNLWVVSDLERGWVNNNGEVSYEAAQYRSRRTLLPVNGEKGLVYQCWNPNKIVNPTNIWNQVVFLNANEEYISKCKLDVLNGSIHQSQLIDIPTNAIYMRLGAVCGPANVYDKTIKIKFEFGNKPTDYSVAPEDVEVNISTAKNDAITSANNTLSSTIENYYTKSETNSQIDIAKEAINLGVSTTYETKTNVETKVASTLSSANSYADTMKSEAISTASTDATNKVNNIQIGGTNLWVVSDLRQGWPDGNGGITWDGPHYKTRKTLVPVNGEKGLVYQCWNPNKIVNPTSIWTRVTFLDSNKTALSSNMIKNLNGDVHQYQLFDIPENTSYVMLGAVCGPKDSYDETIKIKFEFGNKPTDYSVAPEDVNANITNAKNEAITSANDTLTTTISNYYTKSQTDSQINVAKEAIDLSVSNTYETKANVETKVASTLSSANSYADTMKSEAISTASTDATNKVDSAKSELNTAIDKKANTSDVYKKTEIYTKIETDSQINIAKEAIDLSVSNTYETKANVETKVASTLSSANSYADTMKSEAISTASTDATNKVNNIQVGGTNLWVLSDLERGWANGSGGISYEAAQYRTRRTLIPTNGAKGLVYQCWNPSGATNPTTIWNQVTFLDASETFISACKITILNGNPYQYQLIDIPTNAIYMRLGAVCGPANVYDKTIKIKFEFGNKPTDYNLAPEDIESEFSTIESETRTIKESVSSLQLGTDSINASVKSLQEAMTSTTNGLSKDISTIQEQVNLAMTSEDVKLEIQKELQNGTSKVSTSTGFTFDESGLNISKSDSEMKTQITEDGMKIYKNSDIMLTANNQGVDAKNLHATTYLIIGENSRMEDYVENGVKRTAVFWIG